MMKRFIIAFITAIPLISFNAFATPMWSNAETQQYVNIHSEPSDSSEVVATLDYNAVIDVENIDENGWAKTAAGYISSVYLTESEPTEAAYKTATFEEGTYVRAAANSEADVVTTVLYGQTAEVIGSEGEYYKVLFEDGTIGYTSDSVTSIENNYASSKEFSYPVETNYTEENQENPYELYSSEEYYDNHYWEEEAIGCNNITDDYYDGSYYEDDNNYYEDDDYGYEQTYDNNYVEDTSSTVYEDEEEDYVEEVPSYTEKTPSYVEESNTYTEEVSYTSNSSIGESIAATAWGYLGSPYVYGGTSLSSGSDCSGFTQAICALNGVSIPRTAESQSAGGTSVDLSNIQTGDLVYYGGHIGIYVGSGQVIHNSNSRTGVIVSDLYYRTPLNVVRYW